MKKKKKNKIERILVALGRFIVIFGILSVYLLSTYGSSYFLYLRSYEKWNREDKYLFSSTAKMSALDSLTKEWREDPYFQEQVENLPDSAAVIEILLNEGWIYKGDREVYLSLDHYPHLHEIQVEFPSEWQNEHAKISFVGDCVTKAILFANILDYKGISYKLIRGFSHEQLIGHLFVDYNGRIDAKKMIYTEEKIEIHHDGNVYLLEVKESENTRLLFDDRDLSLSYEIDRWEKLKRNFVKQLIVIGFIFLIAFSLAFIDKLKKRIRDSSKILKKMPIRLHYKNRSIIITFRQTREEE